MTLDKLQTGKAGIITRVNGEGELRLRLLDMGLIPNTRVQAVKFAPLGDPMEIHLRGYALTLRLEDARQIEIKEVDL
ncbi:MAG TPA: FeoA family protein [Clostridia bacterium]|jgi:Fe2+ transport system protein FeoA|nr:FeoA family protein [Clostridia bacterium]